LPGQKEKYGSNVPSAEADGNKKYQQASLNKEDEFI